MPATQTITPCLCFDDQAEEAAEFYTATFSKSRITKITRYPEAGQEVHGRPAGSIMIVEFELAGQSFTAINGGPHFKFTPAISLFVSCETQGEVDGLWGKLAEGGSVLMPLQQYPFSERYGWVQDKYGLSWQVMFVGDGKVKQKITPTLMFVGDRAGKAEQAMGFYTSVFDHSGIGDISRYGEGQKPDKPGTVAHADFTLAGQDFKAMDSNHDHAFTFSEAVSFMVNCQTQEQVDDYWEKLSEGGDEKAQQCGWLQDKYGVAWQIVPTVLLEMVTDPDPEKSQRAFAAMLQMKKLDINELEQAYAG